MRNYLTGCPVKTLLPLVLVIIAILTASQAFGEEWSATQKKIWSMEKTLWELWEKGDFETRQKLYHEDCVLWAFKAASPSGKDILGSGLMPTIIVSFDLQPLEIKIFDNVAIVQYRCKWVRYGYRVNYSNRFTHIWMNQDGKWKIIGAMSSDCLKLPPCP